MKNMAWNFFILSIVNVKFGFKIARYIYIYILVLSGIFSTNKNARKRGSREELAFIRILNEKYQFAII